MDGNPDAAPDVHRGAVEPDRSVQCLDHPAPDLDRGPLVRSRQQDGELVAAEAGHGVAAADPYLEGAVAGELQARAAKNRTDLPKGWVYVPGLGVTDRNVDAVLTRQSSSANKWAAVSAQVSTIMAGVPDKLRPLGEAG